MNPKTVIQVNQRMVKILFLLLVVVFCAFECGDDFPIASKPPYMQLNVTPNSKTLAIGDTLWVSGKVTNKILHYETNDSILYDPPIVTLYIYELQKANPSFYGNSIPAANYFKFIEETGTLNSQKYNWADGWGHLFQVIQSVSSTDSLNYILEIGIVPQKTGIFALKNHYSKFNVSDFHRELFSDYKIAGEDVFHGIDKGVSSRIAYSQKVDDRIYFFQVVSK